VTDVKPVWRDGIVVKLCSSCVQKTKPLGKTRLTKEGHLEAWLKTRSAVVVPVVKQKALEDMTKEELEAEIARLSA
jgi:hypothetical protein